MVRKLPFTSLNPIRRNLKPENENEQNDPCFMLTYAIAACINILIAFQFLTAVAFYSIQFLPYTLFRFIVDTFECINED